MCTGNEAAEVGGFIFPCFIKELNSEHRCVVLKKKTFYCTKKLLHLGYNKVVSMQIKVKLNLDLKLEFLEPQQQATLRTVINVLAFVNCMAAAAQTFCLAIQLETVPVIQLETVLAIQLETVAKCVDN
jgi:hypothetical protein